MTLREVNRVGEGQKNIPKLRFKGYEDAWEQRKVSEITKFHKQGYYTTEEYNDNKKYYLLRGTDLTGNKLVLKDTPKIDANEKDYDAFKTELGDFLIVRSGNVGTYGIVDIDIPAIFGSYLIDFRFDTEKVTNEFFGYFYQSERFQSQLNKITQSSANININAENIKSTYISLPVLTEQKKISNIMSALDSCITLHQRKYDALKTMKKTLLSKMFPKDGEDVPEIRFKGFTDAWEQRKLGEVSQIVGGGTPSTGIPEYWDGDIDWYSPAEIGEDIFVSCSQRKITQLGLEKSSAKILPVGTVLFTSRAGIGNTAILEKEGCTNQGFQSIVPKDNELDSYFIFSCSHLLKKYGETKGAGSTFVEISGKQMSLMPLNIPEIKEQKSVGNFFRKLDNLITLHQRKLEELKNMKKTLLQQMFV